MIKIIKPGQREFHGFCKWCGCEFTYEISDLKLSATSDKLDCPTCGKTYYHPSMVQDPTIPGGIGLKDLTWPPDPIPCAPDMTKTDPCAGCIWRDNLLRDGIYVGDTPCTWCNKNKFSCTISGGAISSAVPCPEAHLNACTTSASECGISDITTIHSISGSDTVEQANRDYVNQKLQEVYNGVGCKIAKQKSTSCSCDSCNDTESHNSCNTGSKCHGNRKL